MEKFIELILKEVKEILGEDYEVTYLEVDKKNNVSFPALIIRDKTKNSNTTPTIYLNEYYQMYRDSEDLINIGAYVKGSNKKIDMAITYNEKINDFLCQGIEEKSAFEESEQSLISMFN